MTQEDALTILKTGGNVFLTGEPGSGKTHVINAYINWLSAAGIPVAVTASTGIAATHIGGMTIHSWSSIGVRDALSPYDLDQIASKEKTVKRVQKAKVLVVDEISMLDGSVLDMVDRVCRTVRHNVDAFGGLQVIFVGDFFQLPPVTKRGDVMRYAFESRAWDDARPIVCYLNEQHRQDDELLLGLLQSIRANEVEEEHYTLLSEQTDIGFEGIVPTKLFSHNIDVDAVNAAELTALRGTARTFQMTHKGSKSLVEGLIKNCLSPQTLILKEEALVMCTKNNFEAGYVNGTLGRVVRFDPDDGYPIIETAAGRTLVMRPMTWEVSEDGKVLAEISQIPLRLAWAITIHKSQGMSLDAAEIDLSRAFAYGQGYVALSRVRTLTGLKMLGMSPNALRVDPKIVAYDERFKNESISAEDVFTHMDATEIEKMHMRFVTDMGGKMPSEEAIQREGTKVYERIVKESTFAITKAALLEGRGVEDVAKDRGLTEATVWSHIEQLVDDGELERIQVEKLIPRDVVWDVFYERFCTAVATHGYEKLKPLYEALDEEFTYTLIRLGRALYRLEEVDK